jgi:hypothetical protein
MARAIHYRILNFQLLILLVTLPEAAFATVLKDADGLHSVPTILPSTFGIHRDGETLFYFAKGHLEYIQAPLKLDSDKREQRFGKYTDSLRINVPVVPLPGDFRGFLKTSSKRKVLWDARAMRLVEFVPGKNIVVRDVTVPVDRLRPPRDSMGEPTSIEVEKSRVRFKAAYRKVFGNRYSGIAKLPDAWSERGKSGHLVASMIDGFPLMLLNCAVDDALDCQMTRHCFLDGGLKIDAKNVVGVGVVEKGRFLTVGDRGRHQIHVYRWNSCFDIRYLRSVSLPKSTKSMLTHIVDEDSNLWVGSDQIESMNDSNIHFWRLADWLL